MFEAFDPKSVLVFDRTTIGDVCAALGKRNPNQDVVLQLARRNYQQLLDMRQDFVRLGVVVTDLTSLLSGSDGRRRPRSVGSCDRTHPPWCVAGAMGRALGCR